MEKSQSGFGSISSLLCKERFTTGSSSHDEGFDEDFPVMDDDDEYMKIMFDKEIINGNWVVQIQETSGNWIREARLESINYILNTQEKFGFKIQTAYLAITYLDTFLSRTPFECESCFWAIRLLGVACLTLAAKMEEEKVPILPEFRTEDYNFDSIRIKKMEFLVLKTLNWRMEMITPCKFIHYFVSKFCQNSLSMREIKSRVVEVILVAIKDERTMHYRPSAMAIGATLLIIDKTLTKETLELKINTLSIGGHVQIEDVFTLYNQLKEVEIEKNKLSNSSEKSPLLFSQVQQQRSKAMGTTSVSTTVSVKRKGLNFDQNSVKRRPH